MTLTVSAIVCTYRRPEPVRRLLAALAAQTAPPAEVLVVDGSPDAATETALRAAGLFDTTGGGAVRYWRVRAEHRGLTRQRNWGIARATGQLIAFFDDDTIPEPEYLAEVVACFARHPEAVGVGGWISNEAAWRRRERDEPTSRGCYRNGEWERPDDLRWRLRRACGLAPEAPPGWMPARGHGRPVAFTPPDGEDHRVEFMMGAAMTWRADRLRALSFMPWFDGYGLYEDMDFCLRALAHGPLFLCTRARIAHYHAAGGRPSSAGYGRMVVRNGWRVWRLRWPHPSVADRLRWWATTVLLLACRLAGVARGPDRRSALAEAVGRLAGVVETLVAPPWPEPVGPAAINSAAMEPGLARSGQP